MDTERATGIESTGPTDGVSNDELLDRIEALETRVNEQDERIEALGTHVDEQDERIEELETENAELHERVERGESEDKYLLQDIVDVEKQLDQIDMGTAKEDGEPIPNPEMLPIERVSQLGTDATGIEVTPSIERAVTIFDHWQEWSTKTPKGRVWKTEQKTLLRTATGENLAWNQVYRAFEALEELSKGAIQFVKHKRHGKMMIEPSQGTTNDGDLHASSVGA